MNQDDWKDPETTSEDEKRVLELLEASQAQVNTAHDREILIAARSASSEISNRRAGDSFGRPWLAMAASFVLGIGVFWFAGPPLGLFDDNVAESLTLPASVTRSDDDMNADVAVENAEPDIWFEYIQELVYAGDFELAEKHIRRFNELHPNYKPGRSSGQ